MPIVYPLTPPTTPTTRTLKMIAMSITAMTSSPFTGQQQVIEYPGEWWEMQCSLPPMTRVQAEPWISFLLSLRGRSGTFLMGDRTAPTPLGIATGTPVVDGAAQTGKILNTKGWTASQAGILKAGSYFQVGAGSAARLYKNLTDVNSDGAGKASLDIFPQVRDLPADLTTIITSNPVGQFRLKANPREWDVDTASLFGLSFNAQEAI